MSTELIDWPGFKALHGNEDLFHLVAPRLRSVVDEFITRWGGGVTGQPQALAEDLHRLRGACGAMCVPAVVKLVQEAERAIGQQDWCLLEEKMRMLLDGLSHLSEYLGALGRSPVE